MKKNILKNKLFMNIFLLSIFLIILTASIPPKYSFGGDSLFQYVHASQVGLFPYPKIGIHCLWMMPLGDCDLTSFNMIHKNDEYISPFSYSIIFVKFLLLQILPAESFIYAGLFLFLLSCYIITPNIKNKQLLILTMMLVSPFYFHAIGFLDVAISNLLILLGMHREDRKLESLTYFSLASWFRIETIIFTGIYHLIKDNSLLVKVRNLFLIVFVFAIYSVGNFHFYSSIFGERVNSNLGGMLNLFTFDRLQIIASLLFYGNSRVGFLLYCLYVLPFYYYFLFVNKEKNSQKIVLSLILAMLVTVFFSPNDSNIDWGSRYLSHFGIVTIFLIAKFDIDNFWRNKYLKFLTIALLIFSFFVSYNYFKIYRISGKQIKKFQEVFLFANSQNLLFNNQFLANHSGLDVLSRRYILIPKEENKWTSLKANILETESDVTFIFFDIGQTTNTQEKNILTDESQFSNKVIEFLDQNYHRKNEKSQHNIRAIHYLKKN
ncbi:hypothetical protein P3G55_04300 [Leptospira sp. 96542]|nr:hypothetical protein [Leptospira sp. 96542]